MGQADTCDGQQTPGRATSQGGTAGRRTHSWLLPEPAAPLQEARQQKLPKHLSAIGDTAFKQHSVSIQPERLKGVAAPRIRVWDWGGLWTGRQGNYNYRYEPTDTPRGPRLPNMTKRPARSEFTLEMGGGGFTGHGTQNGVCPLLREFMRRVLGAPPARRNQWTCRTACSHLQNAPLNRWLLIWNRSNVLLFPHSSSCSEDDIKEAFTSNSFEVKAFKFFP